MVPQLHTTTSYTLLHSTLRIPQFVETAKQRGYHTLAITDHNVLVGAVEFYNSCKKSGIKPIIGIQLDYALEANDTASILLYAQNLKGYQNLLYLATYNMTHEQRLRLEDIPERLLGLYGVLPENNELRRSFSEASPTSERFRRLHQLFDGKLFCGVSVQTFEDRLWMDFLQNEKLPLIVAQSVRYLNPEEGFAVKVLKHIDEGTTVEDIHSVTQDIRGEEYLRKAEDVQAFFAERCPDALANAEELVSNCLFELPLHQKLLPHYDVPASETAGSYLTKLCQEALPKRVSNVDERYHQRLQFELEVIHRMGFDDYFLIVWDVMDFAHNNKIVTGAGRGSAAGSLVAYVLAITDVDPIQYDLLFERFLNPERHTMPDIDLDIPDNRREESLRYVQQKYGEFHMAQISTFGTMAAKMVLRDVARVLGLSQSEANRWSKAVPNKLKVTLAQAVEESNRLVELANQSEKYQLLLQTAQQLEGLPRHVSTHAAGVVISDQNLVELVPLQAGSDDIMLTQFTMNDVEAIGLLKMDFLGLRNLSIIDNTLQAIQKIYGERFDFKAIPLDDPATIKLFQKGETSGVFQFESAGIRNVLRKLEPNGIEDIAAVNALYRPGPMRNIDTFVRRKKGLEPIVYPDDNLKDILANTYGVIVYQEQVMQVASKMAGFSLAQADILRRAISKKKQEVLDEQRNLFVKGSLQNGYSEKKANEVYNYIERFGDYGFNRSHAFAYSFVGFQMGYLKVHFPAPFYMALLHSVRNNPAKIKEYISEARKNGVKIIGPNINQSNYSFKIIDKETLLFGFSSLKGIRRDFIKEVVEERKASGPYRSFDQFLIRTHNKWLKAENLEPLIAIGTFDTLEQNRRQLMVNLESKIQNTIYSGGSMDLLDIMTLKDEPVPDYMNEERLNLEEEFLGVYLSGHPTEKYEKIRRAKAVRSVTESLAGEKTRLLFYLKDLREIRTKKGEQMAFLEGNDGSGEMDVTVFPQLYRKIRSLLVPNQVFYIEGKVEKNSYSQELQLLAERIVSADELEAEIQDKMCYLKISLEKDSPEVLQKIQEIMKRHSGHIPIIVFFEKSGRKLQLAEDFWVDDSKEVQQQLAFVLGNENVVFKDL